MSQSAHPGIQSFHTVAMQPAGSRRPLFCVHPLSGNTLCYAQFTRCLGGDQPIWGLQALPYAGEQRYYTDLSVMAQEYAQAIRTVQPESPYQLCGWSFGGIVAFEIAQQLVASGSEVDLLAIIDSDPQSFTAIPDDSTHATSLTRFVEAIYDMLLIDVNVDPEALLGLSADEQLTHIFEQIHQTGRFPGGFNLEQARYHFGLYTSYMQMLTTYRPSRYSGQITLFQAIHSRADFIHQSAIGWGSLSSKKIRRYEVPGDHYSLLALPNVSVLANQLRSELIGLHERRTKVG
jgi:thioesterase domain-containing protein